MLNHRIEIRLLLRSSRHCHEAISFCFRHPTFYGNITHQDHLQTQPTAPCIGANKYFSLVSSLQCCSYEVHANIELDSFRILDHGIAIIVFVCEIHQLPNDLMFIGSYYTSLERPQDVGRYLRPNPFRRHSKSQRRRHSSCIAQAPQLANLW